MIIRVECSENGLVHTTGWANTLVVIHTWINNFKPSFAIIFRMFDVVTNHRFLGTVHFIELDFELVEIIDRLGQAEVEKISLLMVFLFELR